MFIAEDIEKMEGITNSKIKQEVNDCLDRVRLQETSVETLKSTYDEVAQLYDVARDIRGYTGTRVLAETLDEYFGVNKSNLYILDVGAGTGHAGEELVKRGFKHLSALDASRGMLEIAAKKNVYETLMCCMITKDPIDMPSDTYDIICSSGCFLPGHIPYDAVLEMIRLVKPGGFICLFVRDDIFENCDFYRNKFYPLSEKLERDGKWKLFLRATWPNYHPERKGLKIIYKVTKQ